MTQTTRRYVLWAFGLLFFQIAVLNNLNAGNLIFPFAYILFILILPKNIPHWLLLLVGFTYGSAVDILSLTYGAHAFVTTLVSFVRPYLLNTISPGDSDGAGTIVSIQQIGFQKFMAYAGILVALHHLFISLIDELRVDSILHLLSQVVISSAVTIFIVTIIQFIFIKSK